MSFTFFLTKPVLFSFSVSFFDFCVCLVCVEMKRLTHERMKEIEELMSKKEHPDTEKYKAALEKGQANLEKYKKMAIMTQNVLRVKKISGVCFEITHRFTYEHVSPQGIILACKINWMDDPKLRDIAMTLEELPISD